MINLAFTQDELLFCTNALNEVCHGFHVADFEHIIGARPEVETLQERLLEQYCMISTWPDQVQLQQAEARVLVNAARAALHEFEHGGAFRERLGVSRASAFALVNKLEAALTAG